MTPLAGQVPAASLNLRANGESQTGRQHRLDAVNVEAGSDRARSSADSTARRGLLADLDAYAELLAGRFFVQVVIDDDAQHRRTYVYRSAGAAERAVERARDRGQTAHVTLCQLLPVGVVVGLGVPR